MKTKFTLIWKENINKIHNVIWLFLEKFFLLAVEFFVIALVARHLGVETYGVYSFVLSIIAILTTLNACGLSGILVRYCIDPKGHNHDEILSSAIFLRFVSSIVILILTAFVIIFINFDEQIKYYILLLACAEVFRCFGVFSSWFEANLLNKLTAKVKMLTVSGSAILKIIGVILSYDIAYFIFVQALEVSIYIAILFFVFKRRAGVAIGIKLIKFSLVKELMLKGLPLMLSSIGAVIYLKSDVLMIKYFTSSYDVGIYSAATRFTELAFVIPVILMTVLFPSMMKEKKNGKFNRDFNRKSLASMFYLGLMVSFILLFISEFIVVTIYGHDFENSANILAIHCFCLPLVFMRAYVSKWIISEEVYIVSITTQAMGGTANILLNYILIPIYGISGAAYATIFSFLFASIIPLFMHKVSRKLSIDMLMSPFYIFKR